MQVHSAGHNDCGERHIRVHRGLLLRANAAHQTLAEEDLGGTESQSLYYTIQSNVQVIVFCSLLYLESLVVLGLFVARTFQNLYTGLEP